MFIMNFGGILNVYSSLHWLSVEFVYA